MDKKIYVSYEHDLENFSNEFSKTFERWAKARSQNVDELKSLWTENPSRIEVLEDRKFGDDQLVIMHKKRLEALIAAHESLLKRQKKVSKDFDLIIHAINHVSSLSKNNSKKEIDSDLSSAFSLLEKLKDNLSYA
jgi:hypothetical protein